MSSATSEPYWLIGLPFRLGADPARHGATDCLGLARAVLACYGISAPCATRTWYRRLRRGDLSIFTEQLNLWGVPATTPTLGVVGHSGDGGLVTFAENGWWHFGEDLMVRWSPSAALAPAALYSPRNAPPAICSD